KTLGDFRLGVGLQILFNAGPVRVGFRVSVGALEASLSNQRFTTGTRSSMPTGGAANLKVDGGGQPFDRNEVTTGTLRWWTVLDEIERRHPLTLDAMLLLTIALDDPKPAPYPYAADSWDDAEA